ncbi:MAG: CBS domain-containing protein [Vicinamibacteria bacterium]|nr:CBS domain-containing protein [Vicinamibacteria bacterium]
MIEDLLFLTELIDLPVFDLKHLQIARVRDAGLVPLVHPARVDRLLVSAGQTWLTVRHDQIASISLNGVQLASEQLTPYHNDEYMLRVVRDLLDQQIIDAAGRKVVRVSDVSFRIDHSDGRDVLIVRDIDIGIRSILRRVLRGICSRRLIRAIQRPIAPKSILWEYCNIIEPDPLRRLRLNISHERLERLHPADLADIVEDLAHEDRGAILEAIDSEVAAEALSEVEPAIQARIVESLPPETAAAIIDEMAPDQAADLLADMPEETTEEILEEMRPDAKSDVVELLEFAENSAGGMMTTKFVTVLEGQRWEQARLSLTRQAEMLEAAHVLFLVDRHGLLRGAIPFGRLLTAPAGFTLQADTAGPPVAVDVDENRERVIELFDKYNLLALPVIDATGRLSGVITADDIISILHRK